MIEGAGVNKTVSLFGKTSLYRAGMKRLVRGVPTPVPEQPAAIMHGQNLWEGLVFPKARSFLELFNILPVNLWSPILPWMRWLSISSCSSALPSLAPKYCPDRWPSPTVSTALTICWHSGESWPHVPQVSQAQGHLRTQCGSWMWSRPSRQQNQVSSVWESSWLNFRMSQLDTQGQVSVLAYLHSKTGKSNFYGVRDFGKGKQRKRNTWRT